MQPNKTKLALQVGALLIGSSCAFNAAADSFNLTVNTIADVTIAEVTALDFGANIKTDASGSCAMDADQPVGSTVFADGNLTATTYGTLTGANCVGASATPGVYSITGEAGLDVTITLTSEAQGAGDFTFSPTEGCAVIHDGAGTDGDLCTALVVGTPLTGVTIADGSDNGDSVSGATHFTVGGTIAVGATGLTSDTGYVATFNVNVIY